MRTLTLSLFAAAFVLVAAPTVSAQTGNFCFLGEGDFQWNLTVDSNTDDFIRGTFFDPPPSNNLKDVIGGRGTTNGTLRHHTLVAIDPTLSDDPGCSAGSGFVDWLSYNGQVTGNSFPYTYSGFATNSCGFMGTFTGTISPGVCPPPRVDGSSESVGGPNDPEWSKAAVAANAAVAEEFSVTVYPNPMTDEARISYALDAATDVQIVVYDVMGRQVATLVDGTQEAGSYEAVFNARGLSSGTYFYQLQAGEKVNTGKLSLTR